MNFRFQSHRSHSHPISARLAFVSRLAWIAVLALGSIGPFRSSAQSTTKIETLAQWTRSIERAEQRYGEQWSVMVQDLQTGRIIYRHDSGLRLIPASNRKLVTFALAMDKLGPEYRFRTELGLTQPFRPGETTVSGSVVLRSRGDPTLSPRFLNRKNPVTILRGWIAQLKAMGVAKIGNDFIIDASAFGADQDVYPAAWEQAYRNHAYAARPSAIALNRNLLRVSVRPSSRNGAPGRILLYPSSEGITVENKTRSASGRVQGLDAKMSADGYTLYVAGRVGRSIREHVVSVPLDRPLNYLRWIMRDALSAEGIALDGEVRVITDPNAARSYRIVQKVAIHESVRLIELLHIMLLNSDNFLAEQIWRATAARALGVGDISSARRLEQNWYESHAIPWITAGYDGSGLSRRNLVAAEELVAIVKTVYQSPYRPYLIDNLPRSGQTGTLRRRNMGGTAGRVVAKTGTLSNAAALTGFIRNKQNREQWVFSILANAPKKTNGRLTMRLNQIMKVLMRLLDSGFEPEIKNGGKIPHKLYRPDTKVFVGRES